ncbi:MAG: YIP1 family protein [Candidatus Bathyarchaeia archaeon]
MREFSEGTQDYGGLFLILVATVSTGVIAQYLFWMTRVSYYNVDLGIIVSHPEELKTWVFRDALSSELFWIGYLIFRNFLYIYICAWIFKGNKDAKALFMGLGYSLSPHFLCRIIQLILSLTAFPEVRLNICSDISTITITTSLQRLIAYPEKLSALKAQRDDAWARWMEEPAPHAYIILFRLVNLWSTALACLLLNYISHLSKKKVFLIFSLLMALEIFLTSYGSFFKI